MLRPPSFMVFAAISFCGVAATSTYGQSTAIARSARIINAGDTAELHYAGESGPYLIEEGRASGALPGTVKVRFIAGATVSAKFTIYLRAGSISGRGTGELKGRTGEPSFGGRFTITGGTGRYSHAKGSGGFYGVIKRSNPSRPSMIVQTTGHLTY
jgi:hypothetical protein